MIATIIGNVSSPIANDQRQFAVQIFGGSIGCAARILQGGDSLKKASFFNLSATYIEPKSNLTIIIKDIYFLEGVVICDVVKKQNYNYKCDGLKITQSMKLESVYMLPYCKMESEIYDRPADSFASMQISIEKVHHIGEALMESQIELGT